MGTNKQPSGGSPHYVTMAAILLFAFALTSFLLITQAADSSNAIEAELADLNGVNSAIDQTASNQAAIVFEENTGGSDPGGPVEEYTCSMVLGYSQTGNTQYNGWFDADGGFQDSLVNGEWQIKAALLADIEKWGDPGHSDYNGLWNMSPGSPCAQNSNAPDRVVMSISGNFREDVATWTSLIIYAIEAVRNNVPSARSIVLSPVVGGPVHAEACAWPNVAMGVRASWQQQYIMQGIDNAIAAQTTNDVITMSRPHVSNCDMYIDSKGHLSSAGAADAGARMAGEF